jgi:hypothetical protein
MKKKESFKQYAGKVLLNLGILIIGLLISLGLYFTFVKTVHQDSTPIEYSEE